MKTTAAILLTATLFGVPGIGRVVVGPLRQQSEVSRIFHVESGMKLGPLCFSHHSVPASHWMNSARVPAALRTDRVASTSSGPVPSPLITATFFKTQGRDRDTA